jgi:hydrogenase maturation protease
MNLRVADQIAKAVLYEGYMLYPYRPSSVKNQQRWNFGVLCPASYSAAEKGNEASTMQTECLVLGSSTTALEVRVRFLQLVERTIGELRTPVSEVPAAEVPAEEVPEFRLVERLTVDGRIHQPWQEAVEREISLPVSNLEALGRGPLSQAITFPREKHFEFLRDAGGFIVGVAVRAHEALSGVVEVTGEAIDDQVFKIRVVITNTTPFATTSRTHRQEALLSSLVSVHTVLGVEHGSFVSQFAPAESLVELVARCTNVGTWPVLVGVEGESDTMLSSPIILYDYPQIAPESAGDLFDGTEIDEILSLRIMTLTDEEKREMSQSDERARAMLERTESMPVEQLMKLHGVLRGLRPLKEDNP